MKYHKQNKIFLGDKRGNCFQTAVACFLDMDVEDVPNVEVLIDIPDYYWLDPFNAWLNYEGFLYREASEFKCYHLTTEVERALFEDTFHVTAEQMQRDLSEQYYFVSGVSPRNHEINHILIYRQGQAVHDTFPDGYTPLYIAPGQKASEQLAFSVIEKL